MVSSTPLRFCSTSSFQKRRTVQPSGPRRGRGRLTRQPVTSLATRRSDRRLEPGRRKPTGGPKPPKAAYGQAGGIRFFSTFYLVRLGDPAGHRMGARFEAANMADFLGTAITGHMAWRSRLFTAIQDRNPPDPPSFGPTAIAPLANGFTARGGNILKEENTPVLSRSTRNSIKSLRQSLNALLQTNSTRRKAPLKMVLLDDNQELS